MMKTCNIQAVKAKQGRVSVFEKRNVEEVEKGGRKTRILSSNRGKIIDRIKKEKNEEEETPRGRRK